MQGPMHRTLQHVPYYTFIPEAYGPASADKVTLAHVSRLHSVLLLYGPEDSDYFPTCTYPCMPAAGAGWNSMSCGDASPCAFMSQAHIVTLPSWALRRSLASAHTARMPL